MSEREGSDETGQQAPTPGWLDIAKSIGAAFFGVQTEANRRRDFAYGKLRHYVIAGIVATALFVGILIGIVQLILAQAGV